MGVAKDLKKQAETAERAAGRTVDEFAANQMKTLAEAFRAQAEVVKRNKKKKKDELHRKG
ncbi:hypothetical protein [Bradyrhizobium sp. CCBAU 53421]|uniref:hypothetical protein n=1 Tax=Bradyrhizobium sp. CCBAU 53421 TaxID=1325120 RepID=UPI00188D91F7|nr:hypothetical protein [Bradyrhizobium sp. CCBAU 53421]QOZ32837.1 hypothetical protein XH92_15035 [Bradyrhizobium sp. CCBAU 53421]